MGKKKVFMCAWCVAGEMASALLAARRRDADGHQHAGGFLIFQVLSVQRHVATTMISATIIFIPVSKKLLDGGTWLVTELRQYVWDAAIMKPGCQRA